MSRWIKAAKKQDIEEGNGVVSELEGKSVAIFNVEGHFYAIGNICPHRGGPLGEGEVQGTIVTCPWHAWEFDLVTGCHPENDRVKVPTYPVQVEEDNVLVDLEGSL